MSFVHVLVHCQIRISQPMGLMKLVRILVELGELECAFVLTEYCALKKGKLEEVVRLMHALGVDLNAAVTKNGFYPCVHRS